MLLTKVAETEQVVQEVGKIAQYVNDKIPVIIDFVIGVVLSLVAYAIGVKVIGWLRKFK